MTKKTPSSAAALMARLRDDPAFRAREVEREKERATHAAEFRKAAAPLLRDLSAAGFPVDSITDLLKGRVDCEDATPILLEWLPRARNAGVQADILRCLSLSTASTKVGPALVAAFRQTEDDGLAGLRWTIGNALAVVASAAVLDDMIALVSDRRHGRDRQMLLMGLVNAGDPRVVPVLVGLLADEDVCGHAIMALGLMGASAARPDLEPFLEHPKAWVRAAAREAIKNIDGAGRSR